MLPNGEEPYYRITLSVKAQEIELFRNLSDWEFNAGEYWDLHNDFDCVRIALQNEVLEFTFKSLSDPLCMLILKFVDAELVRFDLPMVEALAAKTLDNLYRGRVQVGTDLIELDHNRRGYFYMEFYEGALLEFWSGGVAVSSAESISG
jgi:hypothetical protein